VGFVAEAAVQPASRAAMTMVAQTRARESAMKVQRKRPRLSCRPGRRRLL
jgi:hypothetical protein